MGKPKVVKPYKPHSNEDRAADVDLCLGVFAKKMGLDPYSNADGPITVAGDMIASILHWVQSNDPDGKKAAITAAKNGIGHYVTESYIDYATDEVCELGPDASVEIKVHCNDEVWLVESGIDAEIGPE